MIDISKQTVEVDCPDCKRPITVSIKKVADEALVKCTCGQGIQLKDSNSSNKKAIREINKSLKNLENTIKKFGK
ncbi:MAG: hypothetical protein ISR57_06365 [Bacteroidales bacterium]|nr:hypothetical protein [Bacteroidota bacterium]MBL6950251.1 hypothetical protein [Bacteroidales bacterium]